MQSFSSLDLRVHAGVNEKGTSSQWDRNPTSSPSYTQQIVLSERATSHRSEAGRAISWHTVLYWWHDSIRHYRFRCEYPFTLGLHLLLTTKVEQISYKMECLAIYDCIDTTVMISPLWMTIVKLSVGCMHQCLLYSNLTVMINVTCALAFLMTLIRVSSSKRDIFQSVLIYGFLWIAHLQRQRVN